MTYIITNEMLTTNPKENMQEFVRVNDGFDGKIKASDQRKILGNNVLGRKTVTVNGRNGSIRLSMFCNQRGDEIDQVFISADGYVYKVLAGYWGGKGIPEVNEEWW